MCGLYGGIAKQNKKLSRSKLITLGLYNIQRGVDSCGYYYNGNIQKGVKNEANFGTFVAKNPILPGEINQEIFLGHTRKTTFGESNLTNAHPHIINDNYVQTHNGTIKNIWILTEKYNVDDIDIHVDSIGLAAIIEKSGWDVLNDYIGAAAIAATFKNEPDAIYLYHGKSKEFKSGEPLEERPLFFLITKEGLYYSSIAESLYLIANKDEKVYTLRHNTVFRFKNTMKHEVVKEIDRIENNIVNFFQCDNVKKHLRYKAPAKEHKTIEIPFKDHDNIEPLIYTETLPRGFYSVDIFPRVGRYFISTSLLANGIYKINKEGKFYKGHADESLFTTFYFINGVMLKNEKVYNQVLHEMAANCKAAKNNFAFYISKFSKYPVILLPEESKQVSALLRRRWWFDKRYAKGVFAMEFGKRTYNIIDGLLHETTTSDLQDISVFDKNSRFYLNNVRNDDIYGKTNRVHTENEKQEKFNPFCEIFLQWFNKIFHEEDVEKIPEPALVYVDGILADLMKVEAPDTEFSDEEIELQVSLFLRDCIKTKQSIAELFKAEGYNDIFTFDKIKAHLVENYLNEKDLLAFENRYTFSRKYNVDLETEEIQDNSSKFAIETYDENQENILDEVVKKENQQINEFVIENEKEITLKKLETLKEKFEEIQNIADELQSLDTSDFAQDLAFITYRETDAFKSGINNLLQTEQYSKLNIKPVTFNNTNIL